MPQTEIRENAASLIALAAAHFKRKFTKAETNLLKSAPLGVMADCGVPGNTEGPGNDPSKAAGWEKNREIAAELIRWLCVDPEAKARIDPAGIAVKGARITGTLSLNSAILPFPIQLWYCVLTEDTFLRQAVIPLLDLQGCWTRSIMADGVAIKGNVLLSHGFHADGEVRLLGAQIGESLECEGGTFDNPGGYAFSADRVEVKGGVFLREGFRADGLVRLLGAQIGGDLDCKGGTFKNPGDYALLVESADIKGNVFLGVDSQRRGFTADGVIGLVGAKIGGNLILTGGDLTHAELDLTGTSAASIKDDWSDGGSKPNCWPEKGRLHLDGFIYRRIDEGSRNPEVRLKWLELQPRYPFAAQPYLNLVEVLRAHGDGEGAFRVLMAMEDRSRAANDPPGLLGAAEGSVERAILKETIGYGYRPLLSFWWITGLTGLSWILYRRSYLAGGMVPSEKDAYEAFKGNGNVPSHYPKFSPVIYSVENSLPLVKLGQADKWQPDPDPATIHPPLKGIWKRFLRFTASPQFLRRFLWFQILLGWLLATLFLAGISGVIRKD